jgi:hypothetical protein
VQGKQKCQFDTITGLPESNSDLGREHFKGRAQWETDSDRPPHCYDKIQDGDETDVDCGGKCDQCGAGMGCNEPIDCTNLKCTNGVCWTSSPTPVPTPSPTGPSSNPVLEQALDRRSAGNKKQHGCQTLVASQCASSMSYHGRFVKVDAGPLSGQGGRCLRCFLNFWQTGKAQLPQKKELLQRGDFGSTCMQSGPTNNADDEEYSFG